jgi:integrase
MPRLSSDRVPKYGKHKQSGQARVVLNGRHFLLGPHGSAASRAEYDRLIAEWIAHGRRLLAAGADVTVSTVIARFWDHAQSYYRKPDGSPTSEVDSFRQALRPLRRLYGHTPAADFTPVCLKALREAMTKPWTVTDPKTGQPKALKGFCRTLTNRHLARVKHVFRWATAAGLIPPSVYHGLAAVSGLRKGRSDARESEPVRPVAQAHVDAVLPHLSPTLQALVKLQLLTGARGDEIRRMRTCDVDTTGDVWVYRPDYHKTAHHGHAREIRLGPKAKQILAPLLKPDLQACVFSPADSLAWRRERDRAGRKSKVQPSQARRAEEAKRNALKRKRRPRDHYTKDSYARAIARACDKAEVPPWHPHQLRHTRATELRRMYGLETARAVLGQKSGAITEIYAEVDAATVEKVMAECG